MVEETRYEFKVLMIGPLGISGKLTKLAKQGWELMSTERHALGKSRVFLRRIKK